MFLLFIELHRPPPSDPTHPPTPLVPGFTLLVSDKSGIQINPYIDYSQN